MNTTITTSTDMADLIALLSAPKIACNGVKPSKHQIFTTVAELLDAGLDCKIYPLLTAAFLQYDYEYKQYYDYTDYQHNKFDYYYYQHNRYYSNYYCTYLYYKYKYDCEYYYLSQDEKVIANLFLAEISKDSE